MIHNIDFKTLTITDQRRGTIFSLDVPFTGDARYLRTRPTAIGLKPPLGFIGENKVTVYVPKADHSLEGVQRAFDAILDNIDEHLKHSAESLSAWPMDFRRMVINAINQRINQFKSTAQISAGLTFKPKRRPNAPDLTVLPVRKQIRPEPFNFQLPAEQQFYLAEEIYQHVLGRELIKFAGHRPPESPLPDCLRKPPQAESTSVERQKRIAPNWLHRR